jgi:general stress protein 26
MAENDIDRVWRLMQTTRVCMFSNWDGARIHSRPMAALVRRDDHAIYFFTDDRAHKDDEIRRYPRVCLAFAETGSEEYVSISGTAAITDDRDKIGQLWSAGAKVWWGEADNPVIRLITVQPEEAEFWDSPGRVISNLKVAFALATGTHLDPGRHKQVRP